MTLPCSNATVVNCPWEREIFLTPVSKRPGSSSEITHIQLYRHFRYITSGTLTYHFWIINVL
jgi:hypothetical protein